MFIIKAQIYEGMVANTENLSFLLKTCPHNLFASVDGAYGSKHVKFYIKASIIILFSPS